MSLGDVDGRFQRAQQDELGVFGTLFDENDLMRSGKSRSSKEFCGGAFHVASLEKAELFFWVLGV